MKKSTIAPQILFLVLISSLFLSSCSLTSSKRKPVGSGEDVGSSTVSKAEYDELLLKYQTLLSEKTGKDMNEVKKITDVELQKSSLGETVDLGGEKDSLKNQKIEEALMDSLNQKVDVAGAEKESKLFKLAYAVYAKKDYNKSLKMFQNLEKSEFPQIKVRSKFYIAEILFGQKEFDLAMQLYEEIVQDNAFSGFTLKSLERLVICAKELDIEEKVTKYQSLVEGLLGRKI